jgi:NTE family protein
MKKVHLVLGCGGARGIAHIGVIEMLEKEGYEICEVIGCSMGAVIGGIYCAGYLEQYKEWLLSLNKTGVFRLFDFTFTTQGFVKGWRVFNKI